MFQLQTSMGMGIVEILRNSQDSHKDGS